MGGREASPPQSEVTHPGRQGGPGVCTGGIRDAVVLPPHSQSCSARRHGVGAVRSQWPSGHEETSANRPCPLPGPASPPFHTFLSGRLVPSVRVQGRVRPRTTAAQPQGAHAAWRLRARPWRASACGRWRPGRAGSSRSRLRPGQSLAPGAWVWTPPATVPHMVPADCSQRVTAVEGTSQPRCRVLGWP